MPQHAQKFEKISHQDMRPCDLCKGPTVPFFYVIDVRMAVIDAGNANRFIGMSLSLGNPDPRLTEIFSPGSDAIAKIIDEPEAKTRIYCCGSCWITKFLAVAQAAEERNAVTAKAEVEVSEGEASG